MTSKKGRINHGLMGMQYEIYLLLSINIIMILIYILKYIIDYKKYNEITIIIIILSIINKYNILIDIENSNKWLMILMGLINMLIIILLN